MLTLEIGDLLIRKKKPPLMMIKKVLVERMEMTTGGSNKFYEMFFEKGKTEYYIHWGPIGSGGQRDIKTFNSEDHMKKEYDKVKREKLGKGYEKVSNEQSYIYSFKDPTKLDTYWISYRDLDLFILNNVIKVQKKKKNENIIPCDQ